MTDDADKIMIANEINELCQNIYSLYTRADKINNSLNRMKIDSDFYGEVCRPLKSSLREASALYFELKDKE
jgi:hypothetical protein